MAAIVIYLGGVAPETAPELNNIVAVIAADSGLETATAHGVKVDVVVGDMDSVDPAALTTAEQNGTLIEHSPSYKDDTDCEIALIRARDFDADELIVIGGGGNRSDHLLANISVLCGELTDGWLVTAYFSDCTVHICRENQSREFTNVEGKTVSLIPIGVDAIVTTSGLQWELKDSTLEVHRARGISNVCVKDEIAVDVTRGTLAIIFPN